MSTTKITQSAFSQPLRSSLRKTSISTLNSSHSQITKRAIISTLKKKPRIG